MVMRNILKMYGGLEAMLLREKEIRINLKFPYYSQTFIERDGY